MDTRTWLTNSIHTTEEGQLASVCLRLLAFWGLLSAPFIVAAALSFVLINGPARWVALLPALCILLIYLHLLYQGTRVFSAAKEKDLSTGVFVVLQVVFYLFFGVSMLRSKGFTWDVAELVLSTAMSFLYVAYSVIATFSGAGMPWPSVVGTVGSVGIFVFMLFRFMGW